VKSGAMSPMCRLMSGPFGVAMRETYPRIPKATNIICDFL
jgi:hypothetical protein